MKTETQYILLAIMTFILTLFLVGYNVKLETKVNTKDDDAEEEQQEEQVVTETKEKVEKVEEEHIEEYVVVWSVKNIDIKKEPNVNSETVGCYYWNTEITVVYIDDNWAKVKDDERYINREYVSESPVTFSNYDAPINNTIKSYMDYKCITAKNSRQYKLQQSLAYTGDCGIRMVNGRYCVALGSYYTTTIGQYVDIELENGNVINGILADCKANKHTDSTNRINPNGSVVEFVVDTKSLDCVAKRMGDISYVNGWNSKVVNVRVYDTVEEF